MNFDITNFQSLAANLPVEGEVCYLTHAEVSTQTEINTEIAPLIQQVADTSISAADRLITDLQEVRNHLQSEGERVEREMIRYTKLTQMASFAANHFDTISQCHPPATHKNQVLPKARWLRPKTTSVRSRKIIIMVSGTPPTSLTTLMMIRGARRMPMRA